MARAREILTQLPDKLEGDPSIGAVGITRRGKPVLAVMSFDFYNSLMETLEIMGDPELMNTLRRSIREVKEGKLVPWSEIRQDI